ncbi:MAG: hypothetical protein USCAAHI_02919 [Beijerinckiaceae bacterium]|nr:MAG: hypothetical protein USCAAHI_02919 [Beijerinckiaceae bacterium]
MTLAELRGFDPSFSIVGPLFYGNGTAHSVAGFVPLPSEYSNARSRDATDFAALGRVEHDSRTQSPFGTLRSFIRVDSFYGSNGSAALGSLGSQATTFNTTAGSSASHESTIVNRAFIQFAGLTAGRAQSMFYFFADAINYKSLRGSNAVVTLLAYTMPFGNGFSATRGGSARPARRDWQHYRQQDGGAGHGQRHFGDFLPGAAGGRAGAGNRRQSPSRPALGAAQLSAAAHQIRASLFGSTALTTPPTAYAFPALTSNSLWFRGPGGTTVNARLRLHRLDQQ